MNVDDGLNSFVQCDLSRIGFVDIELYRSSNRITLGYKVFLTRRNKNQRAAMGILLVYINSIIGGRNSETVSLLMSIYLVVSVPNGFISKDVVNLDKIVQFFKTFCS